MGNCYDVYMLEMWPNSLLATITVLTAVKVHWDRENYCCCLSKNSSVRIH